jgi:hypothetical protein
MHDLRLIAKPPQTQTHISPKYMETLKEDIKKDIKLDIKIKKNPTFLTN